MHVLLAPALRSAAPLEISEHAQVRMLPSGKRGVAGCMLHMTITPNLPSLS